LIAVLTLPENTASVNDYCAFARTGIDVQSRTNEVADRRKKLRWRDTLDTLTSPLALAQRCCADEETQCDAEGEVECEPEITVASEALTVTSLALLTDVRYPIAKMALSVKVLSCQGGSIR
jgi:hypothetical protein